MDKLWKSSPDSTPSKLVKIFNRRHQKPVKRLERGTHKCIEQSKSCQEYGNHYAREKNWTKALQYYTKSLCYAPNKSDSIGRARIYRAAMFRDLGLFRRELIEIDKTYESNRPKWATVCQIDENRRICKNNLHRDAIHPSEQLYDTPHTSDVVEITFNEQFGRHLIANADIPVGQVILIEPFFAFGATNEVEFQCQTCLKRTQNFIPCAKCADVVFCDERCKQLNRTHRLVCRTGFHQLSQPMKVTIETILLAVMEFGDVDALAAFVEEVRNEPIDFIPSTELMDFRAKYRAYLRLHKSTCPQIIHTAFEVKKIMLRMALIRAYFDTSEKLRFLSHLLCHHIAVNAVNGFDLTDCSMVCVLTSFFNHSCAPNVITRICDNRIVCLSMRPIRSGDQLFINYLNDFTWTPEKRDSIEKCWGFRCECEACEPVAIDCDQINDDERYQKIAALVANRGLDTNNRDQWKTLCEGVLNDYGHLWSSQVQTVAQLFMDCSSMMEQ